MLDILEKKVEDFSRFDSGKPKLIVIYGPTGSGKTAMSIDIAKHLHSEIISTDSRQIFQYMDIGTGKITSEEKQGVKHHMIDIVTPDMEYSVGEFQQTSQKIIEQLWSENKIPLLVGGTGLYIDSLIYDWDFPSAPSDKKIRQQIEQLSGEEVYKKLQEVDREVADEIHPNNIRRVQRALEIYEITGKSKKDFSHEKKLKYDVLFLSPDFSDRKILYNRINARVEKMIDMGLLDEIQGLLEKGYTQTDFGMQSIGYQEFFPYFSGEISLEEALSRVQQNTRNYAKKQCTWFRKYEKYVK